MALKLVERFPLSRIGRRPPAAPLCPGSRARGASSHGPPLFAVARRQGACRSRSLTGLVLEPTLIANSSVSRFRLTQLRRPTEAEEKAFQLRLECCFSSQSLLKLLRSVRIISDNMAAAALHRVADLEQDQQGLRDPKVLEEDTIRALCFQLEEESVWLTDAGLVSSLMACTRLFLDPCSSLMVRLVSESQVRLDRGQMIVGQLCTLGQVMLSINGLSCEVLGQVMAEIRKQDPTQWSISDLIAVYRLLQGCRGEDGKYGDFLNAMHTHAMTVTSHMDPTAISALLTALVALNQSEAMPLVISLCEQAAWHVPHFSDEELTLVIGALIHFGHSGHYFVQAMENYVPKMAFTSHPETVTKVIQFFGQSNILSPTVFNTIAESFVYRADDYSTGQVARQIIAFGKLGYLPPNADDMFKKVENILHTRISHFKPQMLLNLLHACILVERFPINFVSKVFKSYFLHQLQEQDSAMDPTVLAQLTQICMTVKLECPFYEDPKLLPKYLVKSFLTSGDSLETPVDMHLCNSVESALVILLKGHAYIGSHILTPYCYTLDLEIKVDEDGCVLPSGFTDVYKRIALCIDGQKRFTTNKRQLLGKEAIKQRHLRLLGYEVVQIPFYELEEVENRSSMLKYLHQKLLPYLKIEGM